MVLDPVQQARARLRRSLDSFDGGTLMGEIAGLFTCPENAAYGLRLGNLAELAAVAPAQAGRVPSRRDLRDVANGSDIRLLSSGEDPAEFPITEPLGFEGRVYTVFTGQGQEEAYRAERLFRAISRLHRPATNAFATQARDLVLAALEVSDAVARRSGARRAEPAKQSKGVLVPTDELRGRVTWSGSELEELLDAAGVPRDALDLLVSVLGEGRDDIDPDHGTQSTRPIVRLPDGSVVVVFHHLLRAVTHQILVIAHAAGEMATLAEALADSVAAAVDTTLARVSGLVPDEAFVPTVSRPPGVRLGVYRADPDAIVVAITICDPLTSFDPASPHDGWSQGKAQQRAVSAIAKEAVDWARANADHDAIVLALNVLGGLSGRSASFRFPNVGADVEQLGMEAGALWVAAATEREDRLALVRFAVSRREANERMEVFAFTALDEFAFFHDHSRGFYVSDDHRLTGLFVTSDYALQTRQAVHDRLDRQSAPAPFGPPSTQVEVIKRYEDEEAPIFFPFWPLPGPAMLVRLPDADIWIAGPDTQVIPDEGLPLYVDILDALAFWIWELAPHVIAASPPGSGRVRKTISFQIEDVEKWTSKSPDPVGPDSIISVLVGPDEGRVAFLRSFSDGLMGADNRGERFMVANLVELLLQLFGGPTDPTAMVALVNQIAPLGQKKMLILLPEDASQEIGPSTGLPRQPKVSDWERERLLDGLATKLEADGVRPGPSGSPAAQSALTNRAVDFFFEEIQRLAAELAPEGLMEALLAKNESALREVSLNRLQTPTRVACFGPHSDMAAKLGDEARALTTASIANRFIIELLAASPPTGTKPLTPARYERLLTAASLVVDYGYQSDIARYELGSTSVRVLPSGRLGVVSTDFQKAVGAHRGQMIPVQIRNAQEKFASHWKTSGPPGPPPADLDTAFAAEFGYDLTALRLVLQALADASEVGRAVTVRRRTEVVKDAVALGVTKGDADQVLDDLVLGPRASYTTPPPGFVSVDIWPWLFNRRLSLIRRPLVARGSGDPELLWGFRGLLTAAQQVLGLISEGRLPFAQSKAMKDFQARLAGKSSDEFVRDVAAMLGAPSPDVRTKIEKFGRVRLEEVPGQPLGDIDVLLIERAPKILWAIECKDLVFAKTPRELSSELRGLEEPKHGMIVKHQRRVTWMTAHLADVVAGLGLPSGAWRVVPLITVSAPLPSVHLRSMAMPVVLAAELPSWIEANRPSASRAPKAGGGSSKKTKGKGGRGRAIGQRRTTRRG